MKNRYKYLLIILFSGCVTFHLGAVIWIGNRNYQLTSKDYYDREITYQNDLDQLAAGADFTWRQTIDAASGAILIQVSDDQGQPVGLTDVTVELYRPNDADRDVTLTLAAAENGFVGQVNPLASGRWDLNVTALHGDLPVRWQSRLGL